MSKRPSKQKCIDLLVKEIDKGTDKRVVLANFGKKWQYPIDTFNKHWLEAQERHTEQRKLINAAKLENSIEKELKAQNELILTKTQSLEILSKLAKGDAWKVGTEIIAPTASERINAIKQLSMMQGYNEPTEINQNVKSDFVDLSKLDFDTLLKIKEATDE